MLPEIIQINGNICEFESRYGVTFSRGTAAIEESNGLKGLHLLVYEWVKQFAMPNKRIISLVAIVDPNSQNCAVATVVLVDNGANFTGYEIWDINSNVLDSGPIFSSPPTPGPGGEQIAINPSIHDITITTEGNKYRLRAKIDIDIASIRIDIGEVNALIEIKFKISIG